MKKTERTRHTASFQLSYFLNSKENLSHSWLTPSLISILRYVYDVMEMAYSQTGNCICKKSIHQIALFSRASDKTVERALLLLAKHDFLFVAQKKPRTATHYGVGKAIESWVTMTLDQKQAIQTGVTVTPDKNLLNQTGVTTTPALASPRRQQDSNWRHGDVHVIKLCNNNSKRERKERAPLSQNWQPNIQSKEQAIEVSKKTNLSVDQLTAKFKNLQLSKQKDSANWDAEFQNFLINERPVIQKTTNEYLQSPQSLKQLINPPKPIQWNTPEHPSYRSKTH